jgi:type IV secretion system protein VirB5
MNYPNVRTTSALICVLALAAAPQAQAVWPVVDIRAITQMASQLRTLQNQLATARDQLAQARDTYGSLTGTRGMQQLLSDVTHNALPIDYQQLTDVLNNARATYSALGTRVQELISQNTSLTDAQLSRLNPAQRDLVQEGRRNAAGLAAVTEQVLADSSARFSDLQQLITAIGSATDPKAILDLQARVQAESTMLQNESTKLNAIYQRQSAAADLRQLKIREQGIEDAGSLRDLPSLGL